jgi:hypothetical protein
MAWVPIPDLGKGVNFDAQPEEIELGVASGGKNVRYRAGFAERFRGLQSVYTTPTITPYHITHYTVGTTRYVVYTGLEKTFVDDGTTQTEITNGNRTGAQDDRWTGFVFNGVYIQNNGVDVPQYWGGSGTLTNLTAWPAGYKVGFMRPYGNIIVAGDVTRGGVRERGTFLWSHTADPGTIPTSWDIADATKDAGDQPLAETNGTLIDGMALNDIFVIYKDDALHYAQRVASSQIFRFGRLPGDTGVIARGCVVSTPAGHVYLAPNFDVLIHQGQGLSSILDGRMKTWLASNINSAQAQRSFLAYNPSTSEVLVCFPSGASTVCDKALVWNHKDNTFAVRDLPNATYGSTGLTTVSASADTWSAATGTWATDTAAWGDGGSVSGTQKLLFTTTAPSILLFDSSEQDAGSSFTATYERVGMHFDAPTQVKLVRGVRPKIDAAQGTVVKVQIGAAMLPDQSPTWSDAVDFTVGTDIEAHSFASGRFISLRFYTTGDTHWRIRSCELDIVAQGGY